jgi:hypothetical protein
MVPLDPSLTGRSFTAAPYDVTAERIAEFSRAIGVTGTDGANGCAPYTFAMVIAFRLMTELIDDPGVGVDLRNVVHRDQRIEQMRPIEPGDRLGGTLLVESVRSAAGVDLIVTRTDIVDRSDRLVARATATLVHRGDGSKE